MIISPDEADIHLEASKQNRWSKWRDLSFVVVLFFTFCSCICTCGDISIGLYTCVSMYLIELLG